MPPSTRRRSLRAYRRHPLRGHRPFTGPPEPRADPPPRMGQPIRGSPVGAARRRGSLRTLLARYPLARGKPHVYYAVDASVWPRSDAETSPVLKAPTTIPRATRPGSPSSVAGWAYQWLARLGFAREGWVAFVDVERVRPTENATAVDVEQVKELLGRSPDRDAAAPLFVFDAGYDPVRPRRGTQKGLPRGGPPRASGCRALLLRRSAAAQSDGAASPSRTEAKYQGAQARCLRPPPSTARRMRDTGRCACADLGDAAPEDPGPPDAREPAPLPHIVRGTLVLVELRRPRLAPRASRGHCGSASPA